MQTVYRNTRFNQKNYIIGSILVIGGILMSIIGDVWEIVMGIFYVLWGITLLFIHMKREKRDFISWNDEKIIIQEPGDFPREYKFSEMENFSVSPRFLKIKTKRKEISVDLRSYNREDVEFLRLNLA